MVRTSAAARPVVLRQSIAPAENTAKDRITADSRCFTRNFPAVVTQFKRPHSPLTKRTRGQTPTPELTPRTPTSSRGLHGYELSTRMRLLLGSSRWGIIRDFPLM